MYIFEKAKDFIFKIGLTESDIWLADRKRTTEKWSMPGIVQPRGLIPPDTSRVWGFDCSHWNGPVNMGTAAENGAAFVFIKMADGTVKTNWWEQNYAAAKDKLIRGCYVWLYPSSKVSVTLQVQKWYELAKADMPELPLVIDFEWTYWGGQPANPSVNDLRAAVELWTQLSGEKPLVYTSVGYVGTVGAIPTSLVEQTAGLWVAHYGTINPSIPPQYTSWDFHQFTDQGDGLIVGYDPAYAKAADFNYWWGTLDELLEYANIEPGPSPEPEPEQEWEGTMLRKIATYRKPQLDPPLFARGFKKGVKKTGTLVKITNPDGTHVLYLKDIQGRYYPVRKKAADGSLIWKHIELKKVEGGCPPAEDIPVRTVTVRNETSEVIPILQQPFSTAAAIDFISPGDSVSVWDWFLPDSTGFGAGNRKLVPLAERSGYVFRDQITPIEHRRVTADFFIGPDKYLQFSDGTCLQVPDEIETYTVPSDGYVYLRGAYDWEREDLDFTSRTRSEVPQTIPLWDKPDFYDLREDWQKLWDSLIEWAAYRAMTGGQLKTAWADITAERKALTDNHGLTHGFTDYILKIFLENNKPMKQKGLVFGGTMMRRRFGTTIFALDPSQPAPELPWLLERPWLWGWATVIDRDNVSSKWPNLKNFSGNSVPFLILGYEEKNTLKAEHVVRLEPGQVYSPFTRKS